MRERDKSREISRQQDRESRRVEDDKKEAEDYVTFANEYDDDDSSRGDDRYYAGKKMDRIKRQFETDKRWEDADRAREEAAKPKPKPEPVVEVAPPTVPTPAMRAVAEVEAEDDMIMMMAEGATVDGAAPTDGAAEAGGGGVASPAESDDGSSSAAAPSPSAALHAVPTPAPAKEASDASSTSLAFGFGGGKRKAPLAGKPKPTATAFAADDEEDDQSVKKRKLKKIVYTDEQLRAAGQDPDAERKKAEKVLIKSIPTDKAAVFAFPVDWSVVDADLIAMRLKPWVNRKIAEFIGEEEQTLVDFICSKVSNHAPAKSILADVEAVLDDEAEMFVVKMWRVIIFETEAKKRGLVRK